MREHGADNALKFVALTAETRRNAGALYPRRIKKEKGAAHQAWKYVSLARTNTIRSVKDKMQAWDNLTDEVKFEPDGTNRVVVSAETCKILGAGNTGE